MFFYICLFLMTLMSLHSASAAELPPASAIATSDVRVLSFKQWKEAQTVEASNRVARAANRVTAAKHQNLDAESVAVLEREHEKAQRALEISQQLSMEEYFLVYLSEFEDSEGAIRNAAKLMTHDEMAELLQVMLKNRHGIRAASLRPGLYPELTNPAAKTP